MEIMGTCIVFKSNPENYLKEKYGSKPNTVRCLENTEWVELQDSMKKLKKIWIVNDDTGEHFERELTDITNWVVDELQDIEVWIFSWKSYKLLDN
jgi:hypothetical protein